jgi:uncharacterized protein YyaL (SSP411 family)
VYLHAYQVTDNEFYKRVAIETLEYVRREMLDDSGGFYSTQDADSEGEEGKFFVWTPEEIEEVLGEDAKAFDAYYDVTAGGNFEGANILNVKNPVATAPGSDARLKLFEAREKRVKPGRDEKVLTAWNGLMLAAFADAAAVLNNDEYLEIAKRNAEFILTELQIHGRLLRTWKNGRAKLNGYVEDYANVADGLMVLSEACGEVRYLTEAKQLVDVMINEFWDEENGGFYFTSNDHEELVVRNKDFYDNATPSGNSVAADVLLRLAKLSGDEKYERHAVNVLRLAASQLRRYPQGFGRALSALEFHLADTKEIAVIGPSGNDLEQYLKRRYRPNAVLVFSDDPERDSDAVPLLRERTPIDGKPTAYVCENFVCDRPVTKQDELQGLLDV